MTGRVCRIAAQSLSVAADVSTEICRTVEGEPDAEPADRVYTDRQVQQLCELADRYVEAVYAIGRDPG